MKNGTYDAAWVNSRKIIGVLRYLSLRVRLRRTHLPRQREVWKRPAILSTALITDTLVSLRTVIDRPYVNV